MCSGAASVQWTDLAHVLTAGAKSIRQLGVAHGRIVPCATSVGETPPIALEVKAVPLSGLPDKYRWSSHAPNPTAPLARTAGGLM